MIFPELGPIFGLRNMLHGNRKSYLIKSLDESHRILYNDAN